MRRKTARDARLLGVDVGDRRIGVAASQGTIAVPLTIIEHQNRSSDIERVAALAREREVDTVVIGLALHMSGDEGEQARRCRRFGESLARVLEVPVVYHDEGFSTATAEMARDVPAVGSKRRTPVDDRAAAVMLQSYLDAHAGAV